MGWDVMTHFSYGERWRRHRKWIAGAFQDKEVLLSYRPLQRRETYVLLSNLMDKPQQFMGHIRRSAVTDCAGLVAEFRATDSPLP